MPTCTHQFSVKEEKGKKKKGYVNIKKMFNKTCYTFAMSQAFCYLSNKKFQVNIYFTSV